MIFNFDLIEPRKKLENEMDMSAMHKTHLTLPAMRVKYVATQNQENTMSKLVRSFGRSIIDGITGAFYNSEDKGLVRLFQTEYQRDYRHAIQYGATVNEEFVRKFLGYDRFDK